MLQRYCSYKLKIRNSFCLLSSFAGVSAAVAASWLNTASPSIRDFVLTLHVVLDQGHMSIQIFTLKMVLAHSDSHLTFN